MYLTETALTALLECFFVQSEREFRFLEEMHGYQYISGLAQYKNKYQIIHPFNGQPVNDDFIAITRYERGDQAIEFVFGDNHFILDSLVYFDKINRYEFSDVMAGAKKADIQITGEWGATDSSIITNFLKTHSAILREHIHYFTNPDEKLIKRIDTVKQKKLENAVRRHFKNQITEACGFAAKAFLKKDYARVVSLLLPLERYLGKADLKKLKLAQKHIHA